jgi:hypothetical protein
MPCLVPGTAGVVAGRMLRCSPEVQRGARAAEKADAAKYQRTGQADAAADSDSPHQPPALAGGIGEHGHAACRSGRIAAAAWYVADLIHVPRV